jgi:hypothetical protein
MKTPEISLLERPFLTQEMVQKMGDPQSQEK